MLTRLSMIENELRIKLNMYLAVRAEIQKFKDPKLKKVYDTVELTPEQKKKIDELYVTNYGKKIPYTWHRYFTAFTGNFDEKYVPETLMIPRFEYFENLGKSYIEVFADKNVLPNMAASAGVKMPKTILSCTEGLYRDRTGERISKGEAIDLLGNAGIAFCKPTIDTCSGYGCMPVDFSDGKDRNSGKDIQSIFASLGDNFVVQERVICHESVAKLHPSSCNTFRIITYRWKDGIYHVPCMMRIGIHGNWVDNGHAGGICVAIDDDGSLHDTSYTEFKEEFKEHPDSGVRFAGYRIDGFPKCLEAAKRMHWAMAQLGCVNWDFTLDENNEPVLIEANNVGGSFWPSELAHGKGLFGEKTAEILRWIALMEKCNIQQWQKHKFGKM